MTVSLYRSNSRVLGNLLRRKFLSGKAKSCVILPNVHSTDTRMLLMALLNSISAGSFVGCKMERCFETGRMLDLHMADITYQGPHFLVKRFGVVKGYKMD